MKPSQDQLDIVRTLGEAFGPMIDLCLYLGVTSPELESLVRSAFVQRALSKLPHDTRTGKPASDNRVSIATGVHRSEVRQIRAAGGTAGAKATMAQKQRLYSKSSRVLTGWTTDFKFLSNGGFPLMLPIERQGKNTPSFPDLVKKYAPGTHPGSVLKELKRHRCVDVLEDEIVRFRSLTPKPIGVNKTNVALASRRLSRLGETLFQLILNPQKSRLYAETKTIEMSADEIQRMQSLLEQRGDLFIDWVEKELGYRREARLRTETKRFGVALYSWEENT
jgi:hypothetical protein